MEQDLHQELSTYIHELSNNKRVIELVKKMHPLDVAKLFQKKLDIQPKDAVFVFANFVKESGLLEWVVARRW
jgi:ribosomal protein S2